nr:TRAP transporter permease [Pseudomonas sp.]
MSDHPGLTGNPGQWPKAVFYVAILFSVYQIIGAAFHPFSSQVLRAGHVGFVLLMVYLCFPMRGQGRPWTPLAWVLGLAGLGTALYQWYFEADLVQRSGDLTPSDMVAGVTLLVLVFEAARRVMGLALPLICGCFLAYGLFGEHLPGDLAHRGYDFDQIINQLSFGTEGFYGTPTYVSGTYIFLFILFGAFLEQAGMIRLFTDFAMGMFGHKTGGPAKVSVVTSALMGTITGSGVANVVTTGQFTIPLMKRFGYKGTFAAAVEASASMGSQIMPPIMGAVAFIMAETINVPYVEIAKAALIPALLWFGSIFWTVHLEAQRLKLTGLPKEECPDPFAAIKQRWYLLIPLGVLVYLLFAGFTPMFSGTVGLALTAIVILGTAIVMRASNLWLKIAFWIALGLVSSAFLKFGIGVVFGVIAVLVAGCFYVKGGRETLRACVWALAEGARHAIPVAVACILVGVIIGVVSLTGIATTFAGYIMAIGKDNLFLSLVLTMLTCLVLGMGIPTIPNYIITSAIAAPALLELGVPLIVSHMFVFYFGLMADLTPPVALACFAAGSIAKENGLKISLWSVRIAACGFVVPFMAVYDPALLMQGDDWGAILYMLIKSVFAVGLWGMAVVGYFSAPMRAWERLLVFAAGASLVIPASVFSYDLLGLYSVTTDEIGFLIAAAVIALHVLRARRQPSLAAA